MTPEPIEARDIFTMENVTLPTLDSIHSQRGNFMISMTIAMLAMAVLTIGMTRSNINALNVAIGTSIGGQLSTINTAVSSYISANNAALIVGTPIAHVAIAKSPTILELQALNHLNVGVAGNPTYGDSYNILISVTPSGCTSACQVTGKVWLSSPIYNADNKPADIKLLGAALAASSTNSIGFSLPQSAELITGAAWTIANPDPLGRVGILLAQTGLAQTKSATYWKDPVDTISALPNSGNQDGDTRLVLSMRGAFSWLVNSWSPFNVNQNNLNTNIGGGNEASAGAYNVNTGFSTGVSNTSGWANVFTGTFAGLKNTTGTYNLFNGYQSGMYNLTGDFNSFSGTYSGVYNTSGAYGVFDGFMAGKTNVTGIQGTAIGAFSDFGSSNLSNASAIGYGAIVTASNTIQLGNNSVTNVNTTGSITTSSSVIANGITLTSDRRLKTNIHHSSLGLAFINQLNPVEYNFRNFPTIAQTGFIAQEVELINPTFSAIKKPITEKDFYGLSYTDFIPPMVNAIQEIDAKLEKLPAQKESHNQSRIGILEAVCAVLGALLILSIGFSLFIFRRLSNLQKKVDAHFATTKNATC